MWFPSFVAFKISSLIWLSGGWCCGCCGCVVVGVAVGVDVDEEGIDTELVVEDEEVGEEREEQEEISRSLASGSAM